MERELVEGVDYTVEAGCFIFTRGYLLRRRSCCQSGCRHCPYGFEGREGEGAEARAERKAAQSPSFHADDVAPERRKM